MRFSPNVLNVIIIFLYFNVTFRMIGSHGISSLFPSWDAWCPPPIFSNFSKCTNFSCCIIKQIAFEYFLWVCSFHQAFFPCPTIQYHNFINHNQNISQSIKKNISFYLKDYHLEQNNKVAFFNVFRTYLTRCTGGKTIHNIKW